MGTDLVNGRRSEGFLPARFSLKPVADTFQVIERVFGMREIRRAW